jgi:hypothetical protein
MNKLRCFYTRLSAASLANSNRAAPSFTVDSFSTPGEKSDQICAGFRLASADGTNGLGEGIHERIAREVLSQIRLELGPVRP